MERVTSLLQCKSRNGIQIISLASRQIYPLGHAEEHAMLWLNIRAWSCIDVFNIDLNLMRTRITEDSRL